MPPIKVESFLTIERSLVDGLMARWERKIARPAAKRIAELVEAREYDDAHEVVREITFDTVEEQEGFIDMMVLSAYLFGESFFAAGTLGDVGMGHEPPPQVLEMQAQALARGLEFGGADMIREATHAQIMLERKIVENLPQGGDVMKAADTALAARLNASVMGTGARVVETGANLTTGRLASYGALVQADAVGAGTYQINETLDQRTCPVCRRMHGRVFTVGPAKQSLEAQLMTSDPMELKNMAPFPSHSRAGVKQLTSMNRDQLSDAGWDRPPFHPGCRGVLVPAGTVSASTRIPFTPLLRGVSVRQQTLESIPD